MFFRPLGVAERWSAQKLRHCTYARFEGHLSKNTFHFGRYALCHGLRDFFPD